jgi:very-short-patch-repair endonuclease
VIEIDGAYHNLLDQQLSDEGRTAVLERLGYSVIRFSNEAVLYDIQKVIQTIESKLLTL